MEPTSVPIQQKKPISKYIVFLLVIASFLSAFYGGYVLKDLMQGETRLPTKSEKPIKMPAPSPGTTVIPAQESNTTLFVPGKTYFDDTIIAVTTQAPHFAIAISARRSEQEKGYVQNTGFSFFDGNTWHRSLDINTTTSSQIVTNKLIRNWAVTVDPSRVLKESLQATMAIEGKTITVNADSLTNEIAMRSLPGYTKFMSNAKGEVQIDDTSYSAYILYTRIYSLNAKDIQFYDTPLGLKTYWVAFWDTSGNFYHIDKTSVTKPTDIYKTHEIAVLKDSNGLVGKSFRVDITNDTATPPSTFTIQTNLSNNAIVSLKRINALNKAPNQSYTWIMSSIEGEVKTKDNQTLQGIGLLEYIQD